LLVSVLFALKKGLTPIITYGGALSGRDQNAATKTINGLLKLIHPSPEDPVPEADLEWAVRLALECRRRVKEQQKRIGTA
jgi:ATP-dependent Lon protease